MHSIVFYVYNPSHELFNLTYNLKAFLCVYLPNVLSMVCFLSTYSHIIHSISSNKFLLLYYIVSYFFRLHLILPILSFYFFHLLISFSDRCYCKKSWYALGIISWTGSSQCKFIFITYASSCRWIKSLWVLVENNIALGKSYLVFPWRTNNLLLLLFYSIQEWDNALVRPRVGKVRCLSKSSQMATRTQPKWMPEV